MRLGFTSSIKAAYTKAEITEILSKTHLKGCRLEENYFSYFIFGIKPKIVDRTEKSIPLLLISPIYT